MDCKTIQLWLDSGSPDLPPREEKLFREHLETCFACQKEWAAHQKIPLLIDQWKPKEHEIDELSRKILKAIPRDQETPEKPVGEELSVFARLNPFLPFMVSAFACILLMIVFIPRFTNGTGSNKHSEEAVPFLGTIKGNVSLVRATGLIKVSQNQGGEKIFDGEKFLLQPGDSCQISLKDGRFMTVSGFAEFAVASQTVIVTKGKVSLYFNPSARGMRVHVPQAYLGIRGTTLHIEVSREKSSVWVVEGKVEWQDLTGRSGILNDKEGLVFGENRAYKITSSPLDNSGMRIESPVRVVPASAPFSPFAGSGSSTTPPVVTPRPGSENPSEIGTKSWRTQDDF